MLMEMESKHENVDLECCKSNEIKRNSEDIIEIKTILKYQDKQMSELVSNMNKLVSRLDDLIVSEAEIRSSRESNISVLEWIIPVFLTVITIILSRILHL